MKKLSLSIIVSLVVVAVVVIGFVIKPGNSQPVTSSASSKPTTTTVKSLPVTSFDKQRYSTSDPSSLWVVVNKQHPLMPKSFTPTDLVVPNVPLRVPGNQTMQLRQVAATAVETMFAAAKVSNLDLMLSSGYRSYDYQVSLYGGYVSSIGQAEADVQSARPGFSEHQTGLALDIEPSSRKCEVAQCFGQTPEGQWLAANSYKYGFILRYTPADQTVTGYESEPWHYRYVGVDLATEMHTTHVDTLEAFFRISGGATYTNQ